MTYRIIAQPIANIVVADTAAGMEGYTVGNDGVTRIEIEWRPHRPGFWGFWRAIRPMIFLPYIQVWRGDLIIGQWPQHRVRGVYFAENQAEIDALIASDPEALLERIRARAAQEDGL